MINMPAKKIYATEEERIAAQKEAYKKYNKSARGKAAREKFANKRKSDEVIRKRYSQKGIDWKNRQTPQKKKELYERAKEQRKQSRKNDPRRALLAEARKRAKKKGIPYNLTIEDILVPSHCPVLNIKLTVGDGKRHNGSPSLDRFDNSGGYTKENVRVISLRANQLKNDANLYELEQLVKYMRGDL